MFNQILNSNSQISKKKECISIQITKSTRVRENLLSREWDYGWQVDTQAHNFCYIKFHSQYCLNHEDSEDSKLQKDKPCRYLRFKLNIRYTVPGNLELDIICCHKDFARVQFDVITIHRSAVFLKQTFLVVFNFFQLEKRRKMVNKSRSLSVKPEE